MSVKISSRVWEHSKQSGNALVLMLKLADNAAEDGFCWPGQVYLADKANIDKSTVIRLTRKLEADNELFVARSRRKGNKYIVRVGMDDAELLQVLAHRLPYEYKKLQAVQAISGILQLQKLQSATTEVAHVQQEPSLSVNESSHVANATPAQDDATGNRCKHCLHPRGVTGGICDACGVADTIDEPQLPADVPFDETTPVCQSCERQTHIITGGLCNSCFADWRDNLRQIRESETPTCPDCEKHTKTTKEMPDVHNTCTCKQEAALDDEFGERPPRKPQKPVEHWTARAAQAWAQWGAESDEFQRQLQRFGDSGRIVQELGYKLEEATGLKPLWGTPKKVRWWSSGLWELYEEAGHSIPVAIEAVRKLKGSKLPNGDKMTTASPYSFMNVARALAADKAQKPERIVIR